MIIMSFYCLDPLCLLRKRDSKDRVGLLLFPVLLFFASATVDFSRSVGAATTTGATSCSTTDTISSEQRKKKYTC